MVCRIKPRVSLQLLLVLSNLPLLPGFSKWWKVGAVVVCLGWKQTFVLSFSRKTAFPEFLSECMAYSTLNTDFLYNTFPGFIFNNMGVSPRLCYFCTDDKQKINDNAKKIKLPRTKTWKEFSFPAPFIFLPCFIILPFKETQGLLKWTGIFPVTSVGLGSVFLLKVCCGLW